MSTVRDPGRHSRRRRLVAVMTLAMGTIPAILPGQQPPKLNITLAAGIGMTSPLLVDGNGTTVRLAPAPIISAQISPTGWRIGPVGAGILARLAGSSLKLRDGRESWSGGSVWQSDVLATATLPLAGGRANLTAAGGLLWLRASEPISPLEHSVLTPAGEATLSLRQISSAWGLAVTAQSYRLRPSVGRAGGVARLLAAVTHVF